MPWETRQRGGQYYYQARRVRGLPRRVYCGSGVIGRLHEQMDRDRRRKHEALRDQHGRFVIEIAEADAQWPSIWTLIRLLSTSFMLAAGWYRHKGQWRLMMEPPRTRQSQAPPNNRQPPIDGRALIANLNARANAGDMAAVAEIRRLLERNPEFQHLLGDLCQKAVHAYSALIAGKDAVEREAIMADLASWKSELIGSQATSIESAIADGAVVAKLAMIHAARKATESHEQLPILQFKLKRLDTTLHRYSSTLKILQQIQAASGNVVPASPTPSRPKIYEPATEKAKTG